MAQYFSVHPKDPQPRLIRQAAQILRAGGVIAYPTDSSYALGCQVGDPAAAKRMLQLRGLGDSHFLTLVCRDLVHAGRFVRLANWQFRIIRQGIPGSFTFVLPATRVGQSGDAGVGHVIRTVEAVTRFTPMTGASGG